MRVNEITLNPKNKTAKISLFVDDKSDVSDDMTVDGMPEGYTIEESSTVVTSNADFAFRRSDGTWNWISAE